MANLLTLLLAALLLLPFTSTPAEAKVKSSGAQVHVVKQGDSLYEIAKRHGLTVKQLKRLNGLSSNRLKIGQKLALDRAAAPPLPQVAKSASRQQSTTTRHSAGKSVHIVKKGDSLYKIARRHGVTIEQLRQLNGLNGNNLKIGQKLALSKQAGGEAVELSAAPEPWSKQAAVEQHVVRKGETLSSIARRHHMSVNELKRLNGLRSTRLKIGQRLALNEPYEERSPLLLPGDASENEVLEMAYSASSQLEQAAFNFLSTPYRFGGTSRKGIDCSAFVQQVFRKVDVNLPRSAREQFRVGAEIERDQMQKGDLIFFRTYAKYPSHVGIYLGDGKMIHASSRSRRVVVTSIDLPYYRKRFIGAKRISLLDEAEQLDIANQAQTPVDDEIDDIAAPLENPEAQSTDELVPPVMVGNNSGATAVAAEPPALQETTATPPAPPAN